MIRLVGELNLESAVKRENWSEVTGASVWADPNLHMRSTGKTSKSQVTALDGIKRTLPPFLRAANFRIGKFIDKVPTCTTHPHTDQRAFSS